MGNVLDGVRGRRAETIGKARGVEATHVNNGLEDIERRRDASVGDNEGAELIYTDTYIGTHKEGQVDGRRRGRGWSSGASVVVGKKAATTKVVDDHRTGEERREAQTLAIESKHGFSQLAQSRGKRRRRRRLSGGHLIDRCGHAQAR